jgi:hypothetical protein
MASIRALYILNTDNKILFSRKFPTIENRLKKKMGTEYTAIPLNDTTVSNAFYKKVIREEILQEEFKSMTYKEELEINHQKMDQLLEAVKTDPQVSKIYNKVKITVTGLLTSGVLPVGVTAHNLVFLEGASLYKVKDSLFDLINKLFDKLAVDGNHNGVKQLQYSFIFDHCAVYPINITCDFDFETLECVDTSYSISSKVEFDLKEFSDSYYSLRRKGLIKNKIEKRIIL